VLGGFSFGGYVATQAAARLPEGAKATRLVLVAPAGELRRRPGTAGHLVIHGEADDVVPLQAVLDWARPQVLPVTVVPATGHFFHGQLTLLRQLVVNGWGCPAPAAPAAPRAALAPCSLLLAPSLAPCSCALLP
jgi:alpha/beta superfamily hydrolase